MEEELKLAIKYLKIVSIECKKSDRWIIKQFTKILSESEVETVLTMVLNGEFKAFLETMKEKGYKPSIDTLS